MGKNIHDFNFTYYKQMHYLCVKNAFSQYLTFSGFNDDILHLKVGNEIKIKQQNYEISAFKHFSLQPFFDMDKIEKGNGENFEEIFEENLKKLPLVVLVDVFYLPYRSDFGKYHAMHGVILGSYDEKNKQVGIIDYYEPHFFNGQIPLQDYKNARTSENPMDKNMFSGYSVDNYWYKVVNTEQLLSVEENYNQNVYQMLSSKLKEDTHIYSGIEGIKRIKEYLISIADKPEIFGKKCMKMLHDELFVYYRTMDFGSLYYDVAYNKYNFKNALKYKEFCSQIYSLLDFSNSLFLRASIHFSPRYVNELISVFEKIENLYKNISLEK